MSLIEGEGTFRDFNGSEDGNTVFETTDKDEWEHIVNTKNVFINLIDIWRKGEIALL